MIRRGGGIDYLIGALTRKVSGKRTAELSIAALVSMANLCTANNTIAIITTGPIARQIADRGKSFVFNLLYLWYAFYSIKSEI